MKCSGLIIRVRNVDLAPSDTAGVVAGSGVFDGGIGLAKYIRSPAEVTVADGIFD
jgi:hypothetical protein